LTAEADQVVLDFLGKVADLAQGRMSPQSRSQLIERLRREISERRADRGAEKPTEVRQLLVGLGSAEALVTIEANKDPLYQARQAENRRRGSIGGSVFSPEVDPSVAGMVTPGSLTNPRSDRFGATSSSGEALSGPESPLDPDPFGAGLGEWAGDPTETLTMPAVSGGGPQIPREGNGGFSAPSQSGSVSYDFGPSRTGPWLRRFSQSAAQSHTQAFLAIAVLAVGAALNAVGASPIAIAVVLLGYLLAMTSYSYDVGEKRFAMIGVPLTAVLFYAFGLFLARGRSTGHDDPVSSDTWHAARDWLATLPTMIGLLAALYLAWRLARSIAKVG